MRNLTTNPFEDCVDSEVRGFTTISFFEQKNFHSPSPVRIFTDPNEWMNKVIRCGMDAYSALHRKKALDKSLDLDKSLEGSAKISAEEYAETQENYLNALDKFTNEFIEIHREFDPDFSSEVRMGNVAKNLLRFKHILPTLEEFEIHLKKYFERKNLMIINQRLESLTIHTLSRTP